MYETTYVRKTPAELQKDKVKAEREKIRLTHGPLSGDEFKNLPSADKPYFREKIETSGAPWGMNYETTYVRMTPAELNEQNVNAEREKIRLIQGPLTQDEFDNLPVIQKPNFRKRIVTSGPAWGMTDETNYVRITPAELQAEKVRAENEQLFKKASDLPLTKARYDILPVEKQKLYREKTTTTGPQYDMTYTTTYVLMTPAELREIFDKEEKEKLRQIWGPLTEGEFVKLPESEKPNFRMETVNNGAPQYTGENRDIVSYFRMSEAEKLKAKIAREKEQLRRENGPMNQLEFDAWVPWNERNNYHYTYQDNGCPHDPVSYKIFTKIQ
jgi:hypothetical protein